MGKRARHRKREGRRRKEREREKERGREFFIAPLRNKFFIPLCPWVVWTYLCFSVARHTLLNYMIACGSNLPYRHLEDGLSEAGFVDFAFSPVRDQCPISFGSFP